MRRKILVVDEDPDTLDLLVFLVARTGFVALPARDPVEAITLIDSEQPDLALVDVKRGTASGIALVARLRAHTDMPIVLLNARSSDDDKVRGLEAGLRRLPDEAGQQPRARRAGRGAAPAGPRRARARRAAHDPSGLAAHADRHPAVRRLGRTVTSCGSRSIASRARSRTTRARRGCCTQLPASVSW